MFADISLIVVIISHFAARFMIARLFFSAADFHCHLRFSL